MAKIRLCHVIPNFGPGGAERLVADLMEATDKSCFEVVAVSLYPQSGTILEREIGKKSLRVYFLNKRRGPDIRMIPQLYHFFRKFCPDIVHTHRYVLRYALLPMLLCHIPVCIHTVHNIAQKEVDYVGKVIHGIAFRYGRVVPVSISQEVEKTIRKMYGQSIYIPVIYNGIPIARFTANVRQNKNKDKKKKDLILLHVGRFVPQKNHFYLIKAFALAVNEYPEMRLWFIGDGPMRSAAQELVKEKRLERKVSFIGIRDDIPKFLIESDIFILSSDWEGLPLVVLEAMAAGKPVIATAVGGVPELVENGVTGILVPPRRPDLLAQAILNLAKDRTLCQMMGEEAQRRAVERFNITQTAKAYEELYLKLLKKAG